MKSSYSIDRTQKEVLNAEVDLATARFNVPRHLWRRIIINALVFVPLLVLARYLEQPFMFWFALAWGGGITLWQILFYGFFGNTVSEEELKGTRIYSRGALIFLAIFWTLLIGTVTIALYLKAP